FGGSAGVTYQAAKYVKFTAGLGLTYAQPHLITAADACNPDLTSDAGNSRPCRVGGSRPAGGNTTGVPNPHPRPGLDLPGRRLSADDTAMVDLWWSGVLMF